MKKIITATAIAILLLHFGYAQKTISGTVTDAVTHQPLTGVSVAVLGKVQKTDNNGYFRFSGLVSGMFALIAKAPQYRDYTTQVNLLLADSQLLNINMLSVGNTTTTATDSASLNGLTVYDQTVSIEEINNAEQSVSVSSYKVEKKGRDKTEYRSANGMGAGRMSLGYAAPSTSYSYYAPPPPPAPDLIPDIVTDIPDTNATFDFKNVLNNPFSTFSIDVDDGSYTLMRKNVNSGLMPKKDEVRTEEFINYFDYDYPHPAATDTPFSVYTEMSACPWNPAAKLLHLGIQGYDVDKDKLPPSNLVFLIDVSGSMWSPDKLPLVKKAFSYLVDELRPEDVVSVVVYAGNVGLALPPTHGNDKTKIKDVINHLEAGGSTAGGQGIELAYKTAKDNFIKNGNNRVILATDGDFNVGVSDEAGLVKLIEQKRDDGIFLSVVGCGTGNYQDKKMEQLADHGNGYYGYVDDENEAKRIFVKQMGATLLTIAKDVKLQVEFNPKLVKEYKLIGYENRALKDVEFADDKKDAGELGAGSSVTALYEVVMYDTPKPFAVEKKDPQLTYANFNTNDVMALNIRYKDPKGTKSRLITQMLKNNTVSPDKTSDNFRFSAAVAMTGMILKDVPYKGNATYDLAYALASASKGADKDGYRNEFTQLLKKLKSQKQVN